MKIGVLALQGAFIEHIGVLKKLGAEAVQVRKPEDLEGVMGLVIPGGESTTIAKLAESCGLWSELQNWNKQGKPIFGTCAGLILLADRIASDTKSKGGQHSLGGLDITASRNAYGGQTESFRADITVDRFGAGAEPFPAFFIRAPAITEVGAGVQVVAHLERDGLKIPVAVTQGNMIGMTFHPELSGDVRWHQLFLDICANPKPEAGALSARTDESSCVSS